MKPFLLGLAALVAACSLTNSADECPAVPAGEAVYFPLEKALRWDYTAQALTLSGTEAEPTGSSRSEGTITWELTEVACDAGELRFTMEVIAVWDVFIEPPGGDSFAERLFTRGTVRGFTQAGAIRFEDTILGDADFGVGPRILWPELRWHSPAGPDTLVTVQAGVHDGQPFEALQRLARGSGIVSWHLATGASTRPRSETSLVLTHGLPR